MTLTVGPKINRVHPRIMGSFCARVMIIGVKGKQVRNMNHFQLSMHCDLDLLTPNQSGTSSTHGEYLCEVSR